MLYLIAIIAGVLIATMVTFNGDLTVLYGTYTASAIIFFVGLITSLIISIIKKEKLFQVKKIPFVLYLGGFTGLFTTVFNNVAYGYITVSAILALSLFGQTITSIFIDLFGLFRMPKRGFKPFKIIGLVIVVIGLLFMLYPFNFTKASIIAIIVSLLSGVSCNISRAMNAAISDETTLMNSTLWNYATGFLSSLIALLIFGSINHEPIFSGIFNFTPKIYLFIGGALGAVVILLTNMIFSKMDTLYATLLLFSGQVFSGIVIDLIKSGSFDLFLTIGAVLTLLGLVTNLVLERYKTQKNMVK